MDRIDALRELLAKVEANDPTWDADFMGDEPALYCLGAYRGSLDAAKALHEAVLQGWVLERMRIWGERATVTLFGTHTYDGEEGWHSHRDGESSGADKCPARAWLIAILRALIATEQDEGAE